MIRLQSPGRSCIPAALLILLLSVTAGCSVAPTADKIIPTQLKITKRYPYTVSLEVRGDEEFLKPLELERAIESTILNGGLFTKVVSGNNGNYRLVVDADVSISGAFTLDTVVGGTWRLFKADTGKMVMDEFVSVTQTVTVGEEALGYERTKLGLARTTKKFIEEGLNRLMKLNL